MKKLKLFMILSLILTVFSISALYVSAATSTGRWTVSKARYSFLTSSQEKIFSKAVDDLDGVNYEPVALLAKQVVAGTNYVFLCQGTTMTAEPAKAWYILTATKSPENDMTLQSVKKIKVSSIKTVKKARKGTLDGGLQIVSIKNKTKALSNSARNVFWKGTKHYSKYDLRPITLLGTQVVAGKKYRFLCYGKGTKSDVKDVFVVDIYKNTKGKCSVSSCKPVKLEVYVESVAPGSDADEVPGTSQLETLANERLTLCGGTLRDAYNWAVAIPYSYSYAVNNVQGYAIQGFQNSCGDAFVKAAVFCMMARQLGYEARMIHGYVPGAGGGMIEHAWVEIDNDGNTLICDPDFEYETKRNGYMISYGQSGTWMYTDYAPVNDY